MRQRMKDDTNVLFLEEEEEDLCKATEIITRKNRASPLVIERTRFSGHTPA